MVGKIEKICAGALLALTAHGLYECVSLQRDLTRLVNRQSEIRQIQEERLNTRWGAAQNIDERQILDEIGINERKETLRNEGETVREAQRSLFDRVQRFSRNEPGYRSIEMGFSVQKERVEGMMSSDTENLKRLRNLMEGNAVRMIDEYGSGLTAVYGGLVKRQENREEKKRVEELKRRIEEEIRIKNAKAVEEQQRQHFMDLYRKTATTEVLEAFKLFCEVIKKRDYDKLIGLQSAAIDKPYTEVTWINELFPITHRIEKTRLNEGPQTWSITPGTKDKKSGKEIERIDSGCFFEHPRPADGYNHYYKTWTAHWQLKESEEVEAINKSQGFRSRDLINEMFFVEFMKVNDNSWRIGKAGRFDIYTKW